MRKTMHEIIDETVEFYSNNPRSLGIAADFSLDTRCLYNGPDGTKCAFARLVKDEFVHLLPEGETCVFNGVLICPMEHLKEEYQGHPPLFYSRLQRLHDQGLNWIEFHGKNVLSETGVIYVDRMKEDFYGR